MRVVQVSCWLDPQRRQPEELLEAWPTLVDVASAAATAGAEVTVVQAAHFEAQIQRDGVHFIFVAAPEPSAHQRRRGTWSWPLPRSLARRVRKLEPDVIHLHGLSFPRQARLLRTALPDARLLVQDHADHAPPRWRAPVHSYGLAAVDAVAFTAVAQASPFLQLLPEQVRVFEIPESSSRFEPGDRNVARSRTGLSGDPCLLWVGNLDRNKDPLAILDAFANVAAVLPDASLWMAWRSGAQLDDVKLRIDNDAVLRERVTLLGERPHDEIEYLLRSADFLVQGSHTEGSGYAVIEAFACGVVPLVTDIPSFRSLTADGRYGGLSPAGDAAAMARTWIDWVGRDRTRIRDDALAHFARSLSFAALGERLRNTYAALIDS